jgi:hypothetical protein
VVYRKLLITLELAFEELDDFGDIRVRVDSGASLATEEVESVA